MEYTITVPGVARGKGRPRFGNGRTFTDSKTANAEAWVKVCAMQQVGQLMLECPLAVLIKVTCEIPASWSKVKRALAANGDIRPTARPDVDNIAKLACDSLNKIIWRDDAQIVTLTVAKVFGPEAGTEITVETV
jgi:Holliday junction resolvase RusA-like endonuclease